MHRRGSLLVEVAMAATLVAVAMIAVAQLLALSAQQERAVDQRRLANQEAANALEQVLARSWESVTPEGLQDVTLSPDSQQRLPDGQLQFELKVVADPPVSKQIVSVVSWRGRGGDREQVRLAVWRFSAVEAKP